MRQSLIRFYKVGKFLHYVALLAFGIAIFSLLKLLTFDYSTNQTLFLTWLSLLIIFGSMSFLAELDGYSRYQNYKQVKDQLFFNGYQERLLKPLLRSSCQREAAILAGLELGVGKEVKSFYYKKGYRWFHIIPDFVFQYPFFFFSIYFWRTTFFTPYYESRVNYDLIDLSDIDLLRKGIEIETAS